jgi:excinuclease ABC subunit C
VKRLAAATPEEIIEVPGIGRRTAEAVLAALNPAASPEKTALNPAVSPEKAETGR